MAFRKNDYKQLNIFDSYVLLDDRCIDKMQNGWPGLFHDQYLRNVNEERFSVLYNEKTGRPNYPVNVLVTAMALKAYQGLTDEGLSDSILFDSRFQYALGVNELAVRDLEMFRKRLEDYMTVTGKDLLSAEIMDLAIKTGETMGLGFGRSRMDSLQIASHSEWISRLGLVYRVNSNALRLMDRLGLRDSIPENLQHYMENDDENRVLYHNDTVSNDMKIKQAIRDAEQLRKIMEESDEWKEFTEYRQLVRVLEEQSSCDDEGKVVPKAKEDLKASCMQNPSDPEATYRSKAGKEYKGYVGNIEESYEAGGKSVIIHFDLQPNVCSDIDFLRRNLEERISSLTEETPWKRMVVDGAYFSAELFELALSARVNLIPTALTGRDADPVFARFEMNGEHTEVIKCPCGNCPLRQSYNEKTGTCRCVFEGSCCEKCPYREQCAAKAQKNTYVVIVSQKKIDRAKISLNLSGDDAKACARERNAVEGVMSVLRRRYGIDEIAAYRLNRMRQFFACRIAAYNMRKLELYYRREAPQKKMA